MTAGIFRRAFGCGLLAALMVAALAPNVARAQAAYPSRIIKLVVGFAAGGGNDIIARILAAKLQEELGGTVIVENRAGAGGRLAAEHVMKAAPDGYQLLLATAGTHAVNQTLYKKPLYNAATDFAPVGLLARTPIVLVTRRDLPVDDLPQFIAYAKAHRASMQYGSPGVGSASHLACVLFNAAIGIEVTHVPYRSTGQALQDLLPGRLDYQCVPIAAAVPQVESKTLKAIAIMARTRSPILPMLPTAHEQGLADFEVDTWYAIFLPKGTPPPIIEKLNASAIAAMNSADVQARLDELGIEVVAPERRSPGYLAEFVVREIAKWAGPIRAAGLSMD